MNACLMTSLLAAAQETAPKELTLGGIGIVFLVLGGFVAFCGGLAFLFYILTELPSNSGKKPPPDPGHSPGGGNKFEQSYGRGVQEGIRRERERQKGKGRRR